MAPADARGGGTGAPHDGQVRDHESPLTAALLSERRGREVPSGHVLIGPTCSNCTTRTARLRVKLRHSGRVTVTILDSSDHTIRTIASHVPMQAKTPRLFVWDGLTDTGRVQGDSFAQTDKDLDRYGAPVRTVIDLDA